MIEYLILNLLYACGALTLIYLIGKFITSFFKEQPSFFLRLFITYSVGLLALIFCYSVVKAGGKTINLMLLPALFILVYSIRDQFKKPVINLSEISKELSFSLLFLIPIFLFQGVFYTDIIHGSFKPIHTDYFSYADYANSLKLFGAESRYPDINYFFPEQRFSLVPYHYPELWATAFFSSLFHISTVGSYFLIVVPLLLTIYLIGIMFLFEGAFKSVWLSYVISVLCLFITGFHDDNGVMSLFTQKLVFIYIYGLLAFIVAIRFQNYLYIIILSVLPILSISFLPFIFGGILLFNLVSLVINKFKFSREIIFSSSLVLINMIGIGIFYLSFKSDYTESVVGKEVFIYKLLHNSLAQSDIRSFIANFIKTGSAKIGMYLPFLLVIIYYFNDLKKLWYFLIPCFFVAIISFCLMFDTLDAKQFADNPNLFIHILIIIGISFYFKRKEFSYTRNLFLRFIFLFLVSFGLIESVTKRIMDDDTFDNVFFKKIESNIKKDVNMVMVFLNPQDYVKFRLAWSCLRNELLPIHQYTSKNIIFTLGNSEVFFDMNKKQSPEDSFYYKYLIPVNIARDRNNVDLSGFIKKHNIEFIYTKKDTDLPDYIQNNISTKIVSAKTGDVFCILKQSNP